MELIVLNYCAYLVTRELRTNMLKQHEYIFLKIQLSVFLIESKMYKCRYYKINDNTIAY
jgi:hypothetical protein